MPVVGGATVAISPDLTGFRAELEAKMDAVLAGLHPTVHVNVEVDKAHLALDAVGAKAAGIAGAAATVPVRTEGTDRALADIAAVHAAAGGRDGRGILGPLLGFGTGMLGLAGFGTLGSLAGFGPEHLLTTGLGLAGSLGAGAAGGGLLAAGALGTAAVGMGTDLAGIGQAVGDIKNTTTAMTALNQAVQMYGKNSAQAAQAQDQLNMVLANFSPIARGAVLQAATMVKQFTTMFDSYTGYAEKTGAQVITQAISVGEKFLPTIGAYAAANLKTIQAGLQPLFSWLASQQGGLGIFTDLERKFRTELPTSIHALTQGVELFAHTIDFAAQRTGSFITKLDAFLTKANSPTGLEKWHAEINRLINDFHMWMALFTELYRVIRDVFRLDAFDVVNGQLVRVKSTSQDIVQTLTQLLTRLDRWVNGAGRIPLVTIFEVHRKQILALLNLLPGLLSGFAKIYTILAPPLVRLVTDLAKALTAVMNWIGALNSAQGPLGAISRNITSVVGTLGGLVLIMAKTGTLAPIFGLLSKGVNGLATSVLGLGSAAEEAGAETEAALGSTGVGLVLVGLGIAAVELWQHWSTVSKAIVTAADWVRAHWKLMLEVIAGSALIIAAIDPPLGILIGVLGAIAVGVSLLMNHWHSAWHDIVVVVENAVHDAAHYVNVGWDAVVQWTGKAVVAIIGWFNKLPGYLDDLVRWIEDPFYTAINDVSKGWGLLENVIIGVVNDIPQWLNDVVKYIEEPFVTALNFVATVWGELENIVIAVVNGILKQVQDVAKGILGIFGPIASAGAFLIGKIFGGGRQKEIDALVKSLKDLKTFQLGYVTPGGTGAVAQGAGISPFNIPLVQPTGAGLRETGPFGDKTLGINMAALNKQVMAIADSLKLPIGKFKSLGDGLVWLTDKAWDAAHGHEAIQKQIKKTEEQIKKTATDLGNVPAVKAAAGPATPQSLQAWQQAMQALDTATQDAFQAWQTIKQDQETLLNDQQAGALQVKAAWLTAATDMQAAAQTLKNNAAALAHDASQAIVQHMGDLTTTHVNQLAAQTTAIQDAATIRTDQGNNIVSAIQDSATLTVDKMALWGKSGIDRQIQLAQISLDQVKATQDTKIGADQLRLDTLKMHDDQKAAKAQAHVDAVAAQQDAKVAAAQQNLDRVTMIQGQHVAMAQANLDRQTAQQDAKVAAAQDRADAQAIQGQLVVNKAQAHLDWANQFGTVKQQELARNALTNAQVAAGKANEVAVRQLGAAQREQKAVVQKASDAVTRATNTQTSKVNDATRHLQKISDHADVANANAKNAQSVLVGQNNKAEATAQAQLDADNTYYGKALAQGQKHIDILTEIKNQGGQATTIHFQVGNTPSALEAAAAVAFRLKVAGVY